jgi:hypothetical protein
MVWLLGVFSFYVYEELSRDITLQDSVPVSHNFYLLSHLSLFVCVCVCVGGGGWLLVHKCKLITVNGLIRKEQR